MTRVGFVITANKASWLGGLHYLDSLITAVTDLGTGEIEPVILLGRHFDPGARRALPDVETHETGLLDPLRPGWILRGAAMVATRNDLAVGRLLRRWGVDVVSHSGPLGRRVGLPSVAWVPDFQHVHLPEFFEKRELISRDRQFHRLFDESARVLLSSDAALEDLRAYHPPAIPKARVLHFAVEPPAGGGTPREELLERHGLRQPFLYLPNQFWAHKNHRVAIDALALLAEAGVDVTIAASGDAKDYRRPGYHEELVARIRELRIEDRFRLLGRVPYPDVVGLMQACTAVLNPSLFEGWSTTVEEAKSLGKRTVLSDIPVHREQAPPAGVYFEPRDPESLADAIRSVLADADPGRDAELEATARAQLPERRRQFAQGYESVLREALGRA